MYNILKKVFVQTTGAITLAVLVLGNHAIQADGIAKLDLNDVSILFPPPRTEQDMDLVISIDDIMDANGKAVWSDEAFRDFVDISTSDASLVAGSPSRISFKSEFSIKSVWHIAGLRVDPSAPGGSEEIREQFGESAQIRLILQPVTRNGDGTVTVHDFAAHMIYGYHSGAKPPLEGVGCRARAIPDKAAFDAILADISSLKTRLAAGQLGGIAVTTDGVPLGIHPGLKNSSTAKAVRDEIKTLLAKHLSDQRLFAMAVMGLQPPEPWIFVAMGRDRDTGKFSAVPSPTLLALGPVNGKPQTAQMLSFRQSNNIDPVAVNNNLNPITCKLVTATPSGVSTAELFQSPQPSPGRALGIVDVIADPTKSHFFNTDCVSCHTETRRDMKLLGTRDIEDIETAVLPKEPWNVRNFGWFPSFFTRSLEPTVTRRTATETREVLHFINSRNSGN